VGLEAWMESSNVTVGEMEQYGKRNTSAR